MKIKVGTRGSKLAVTQTKWVVSRLQNNYPDAEFEIKEITTTGDRLQNVVLDKIGEKGVFVKEIEEKLISEEIDLAVHSMKDMPGVLPKGLKFSYVPKREDYRDVIIFKAGYSSLQELPKGAVIGTGSKRRMYQLLNYRKDLNFMPIRGNIDTRIRKIKSEKLDGIVLAAAGLKRLGIYQQLKGRIETLDTELVLPSPGQGALAIEIKADNTAVHEIIKSINHEETYTQVLGERGFLKGIGGNCHIPIGALCTINGVNVEITGLLGNESGDVLIKKNLAGPREKAEEIGFNLAKIVLEEMKRFEG